jgi:hypothetical protein
MTATSGRSGGLAAILAGAAIALAACGGSSSPRSATSPTVASLPTSTIAKSSSGHGGGVVTTTLPTGNNPTALVDEWAACMRSQGDPNQSDPIIDSHGVIDISTPLLGEGSTPGKGKPPGDPHGATGTCSQYLVKAQVELRIEYPVPEPQGPSEATYLQYVYCMRADGVPNFPFPYGPDDSQTNFNGTGVDPDSPQVVRVNDLCGQKLGLPTWWINGWGPPGDISVSPPEGGPPMGPPVPAGDGGSASTG